MKLRNKDILSKFTNDQFINIIKLVLILGIMVMMLYRNSFFEVAEFVIILLVCTLYLHIIGKEMNDSIEKFQKEFDKGKI